MMNERLRALMALTRVLHKRKILVTGLALAAFFSLTLAAAVPPAQAALAAPTDLTLEKNSDGDVVLSWINNAPEGQILGYQVERQEKGVGSMTIIDTLTGNVNTYTDIHNDSSALNIGKTYQYRVYAFSFDEESGYSNVAEIKITFHPDPDTAFEFKPAAPTDLAAVATDSTHISLTWTDNADNENAYIVKRQVKGVGTLDAIVDNLPADTTAWIDDTVAPGTTYVYAVCCSKTQNSNDSNSVEVSTPGAEVPAAPANLTAEVEGTRVILNWNDLSTDEDGFVIERMISGSASYNSIHTIAADLTTYTDTNVEAGTSYDYRVCATNVEGQSAYTNVATAVIPDAEAGAMVLKYYIGNLQYLVNGQSSLLDSMPVVIENRILLPIKFVVTPLGGTAAWDPVEKKATINCNGHELMLWLNSNNASVDGVMGLIDAENAAVMPVAMNDRIMMPLRYVGENLDCGVAWNQGPQEAVLTYPDPED